MSGQHLKVAEGVRAPLLSANIFRQRRQPDRNKGPM